MPTYKYVFHAYKNSAAIKVGVYTTIEVYATDLEIATKKAKECFPDCESYRVDEIVEEVTKIY